LAQNLFKNITNTAKSYFSISFLSQQNQQQQNSIYLQYGQSRAGNTPNVNYIPQQQGSGFEQSNLATTSSVHSGYAAIVSPPRGLIPSAANNNYTPGTR